MFLSNSNKVVVSKQQVSSDLGGEAAILNLKDGIYYGLDSIGARVWNLIHEPRTLGELRDILVDEYDVDEARLESDLHTLLTQLADKHLVEIQG